jgi:hypothetical protein
MAEPSAHLVPGLPGSPSVLHSRDVKVLAALAVLTVACSGAVSPGSSSSKEEGGTCHYPPSVADSDASSSGCFARPPGQICQVSNGASVNLDEGGVTGGTETCQSLCGASQYEMTCRSVGVVGAIPDPASSLGCKVIPLPTPPTALFYCCPCAG